MNTSNLTSNSKNQDVEMQAVGMGGGPVEGVKKEVLENDDDIESAFENYDSQHLAYNERNMDKERKHMNLVEKTVGDELRSHHIMDELEIDKEKRGMTKKEERKLQRDIKAQEEEAKAAVELNSFYDVTPDPLHDFPEARADFMRAIIAFLALGLLWSTSFVVCGAIADTFVPTPPVHELFNAVKHGYDVTVEEHDNYVECIPAQVNICNQHLNGIIFGQVVSNKYIPGLVDVLNDENQQNLVIVNEAQTLATECSAVDFQLTQAIKNYQKGGTKGIPQNLPYYPTCSTNDQNIIASKTGQVTSSKLDAIASGQSYSAQVMRVAAGWDNNLTAYTNYNEEYINNKTEILTDIPIQMEDIAVTWPAEIALGIAPIGNIIDAGIACISLGPNYNGVSCPTPNIDARALALAAQNTIQSAYTAVRNDYQENLNVVEGYVYEVENVLSGVQSFFNILLQHWGPINNVVKITLPSIALSPPPMVPIPALITVQSIDQQWAQVKALADQLTMNVSVQLAAIGTLPNGWIDQINVTLAPLPAVLKDYNPPPVVMDTAGLQNASDTFNSELTGKISNIEIPPVPTVNITKPNIDLSNTSFPSNVRPSANFKFAFVPLAGKISFDLLISAITNIRSILSWADIIYRFYRSYVIVMRYWRKGAVGIPPIDVRDENTIKGPRDNYAVLYAKIISNPLVLALGSFIILFLIVMILVSLYLPSYESYIQGCVKTDRGTMISANMYSIAYNYASSGGNTEELLKLNEYDIARSRYCGTFLQQSVTEDNTYRSDIANSEASQQTAWADIELFSSCINYTAMGTDPIAFESDYNATLPSLTVQSESSCLANISSLPYQTALFNCSALPPCSTTCYGVNNQSIYQAVWYGSCFVEWEMQATFLRGVSIAIIYICLNIGRYIFIWGISHLNWRTLTYGGFAFLGTVSQMGNTTAHKKLVKPLSEAIRKYQREGIIYVATSFLLLIPCIVWLSYINQNIVLPRE